MAEEYQVSSKRALGTSEEAWTRCTASGTGIGVFAVALNRDLEMPELTRAATLLCDRHALLRSQIVNDSSKPKKLSFEVKSSGSSPVIESLPWPADFDDSDSSSGILLLPRDESPDHSLSKALHAVVTRELNSPVHLGDYPVDVFRLRLYPNPSLSESILVLRFHSGACDRHSSAVAADEFLRLLDEQQPLESSDRAGILPAIEDLLPKSKAAKGFFKKGLDAVGYAYNSSKSTLLPFQPGFPKSCPGPFASRIVTSSLKNPDEIFAACKKESTTFPAALSAAFLLTAVAVKELKDKKQDTFSFTKVLSCRPFFEPALDNAVLGNYSAGLPQDEQVKDGVGFWDLARSISAATEKSLAKSHHFSELSVLNMLLTQVIKHPNLTPASSMRTALFTVFVDEPVKFSLSSLEKLKVAGTIGPLASMHFVGPCFSVAEALVDNELCLSFVYTEPIHSRQQIESFVTSALELLAASK